jgi:hypothetical protein
VVEYVLLLAGGSFRGIASEVTAWLYGHNWNTLAYALLALIALRIAFWAFRLPE